VIGWIHNSKCRMLINSIHNKPKAVNCVSVTNPTGCRNVVWRPTCKPLNGTGKSDIWWNLSIAIVPWQASLATCSKNAQMEQDSKMLERLVWHTIRLSEVHRPKFIVNVTTWPLSARSQLPP
jgi:hypothetical protein